MTRTSLRRTASGCSRTSSNGFGGSRGIACSRFAWRHAASRCLRRCAARRGNGVAAFDAILQVGFKIALTAIWARVAGFAALVVWAVAAPDASVATRTAATVNAPQVVASVYCLG